MLSGEMKLRGTWLDLSGRVPLLAAELTGSLHLIVSTFAWNLLSVRGVVGTPR
jgi:hypothetical protein